MKILNYKEFDQCFEHYKTLFPDTFTKMDEIIKILNQDYKETGGSGLFGIQVASDWEDRATALNLPATTKYKRPISRDCTKAMRMIKQKLGVQ